MSYIHAKVRALIFRLVKQYHYIENQCDITVINSAEHDYRNYQYMQKNYLRLVHQYMQENYLRLVHQYMQENYLRHVHQYMQENYLRHVHQLIALLEILFQKRKIYIGKEVSIINSLT